MRSLFASLVFLVAAGVASSAAAPQYLFSFSVQVDQASPVPLNASVSPGTSRTLQASPHLSVEIQTPNTVDDSSTTVVKLIDDSSGTPVVLHTSRRTGPITLVRTFGYLVCDGKATFQSPLETAQTGCEKRVH